MSTFHGLNAVRPWPVYLLAASAPLSMAATSLAKLFIVLAALCILIVACREQKAQAELRSFIVIPVILLMLGGLTLSLLWTEASPREALSTIGKYAKLLVIPAILILLKSRREAVIALTCYLVAQGFVVCTSVLLGWGVPLPWVPGVRNSVATVYSSYLDQSIMTAGFAAICWNLRKELPEGNKFFLGTGFAVLALYNVIFQLPGRSGHLASLVAVSLALFWGAPPRKRILGLLAPFMLFGLAYAISPQFKDRVSLVSTETISYVKSNEVMTSSGLRLHFWHSAYSVIAEKPIKGFGAGSWAHEFQRVNHGRDTSYSGSGGNPHQEYLLWGIHLGLPGIALLVSFFAALAFDGRLLVTSIRHALWTIVGILAVVCLFNSTLYDALIGDYFCMLFGVLLALGWRDAQASSLPRPGRHP